MTGAAHAAAVPPATPAAAAGALDVLAVIVAPLEMYPPSVNQVALLAEAGLRVGIVETFHPERPAVAFAGNHPVERLRTFRHTLTYKEPFPPLPVRLWNRHRLRRLLAAALRARRPRVVIAYDDVAVLEVARGLPRRDRPRTVCHFHELSWYRPGDGWTARRAYGFSRRFARQADLVVVADPHRARHFAEQAGLSVEPAVVRNCPRRLDTLPRPRLREALAPLGLAEHAVVYFQGIIGPDRGLETVIRSMAGWPPNAAFVLVGPVPDAYRAQLLAEARGVGAEGRVAFLGGRPHEALPALAAGADVAVALFPARTEDLNFLYLAGASNKRYEYMSLGLPQVTNVGPGMHEVIEEPGAGVLVEPDDAGAVGQAVRGLLDDADRRRAMGARARRAHLEQFHYERQFQPVLARILEWTR